jgi:hypothetical protein
MLIEGGTGRSLTARRQEAAALRLSRARHPVLRSPIQQRRDGIV